MAARLEALAQYYQQHGFPTEAQELRQKAEEYRRRGMPDAFSQESSLSAQNALQFTSPNQPLELAQDNDLRFRTKPINVPRIGGVILHGDRGIEFNKPPKDVVGVTIRDGKMIKRKFTTLARQEDQFELQIELEEDYESDAIQAPSRTEGLFCRMDIDGFPQAFETELDERQEDVLTHQYWGSIDPTDRNTYAFFASPEDIALLSKLSFSFYSKPH